MERSRSTEGALPSPISTENLEKEEDERGGRRRHVKATSLLFKTVPSSSEIADVERDGLIEHVQPAESSQRSTPLARPATDEDMSMDIDEIELDVQPEEAHQVWGMPRWGWEEERKEVRRGVRLVGVEEVRLVMIASLGTRLTSSSPN